MRKPVPTVVRLALLSLAAALAMVADNSSAYEAEPTHEILANRSIDLAITDSRYEEIGLGDYRSAIKSGAVHEDDYPRFVQHFYDPSTSLGLPENYYTRAFQVGRGTPAAEPFPRYMSAVEWARDGMPDGLHWKGAIETYDYTSAAKRQAYTALGHVLHLLHDMAQPDHARNRPHPCNQVGSRLGLKDYVGYETLWTTQTWPRATISQKIPTLEEAFTALANESKTAEDALGLPLTGELTLGCGPQQVLIEQLRTSPLGAVIYTGNVLLVIKQHGWNALFESHWQQTDLNLPVWPTIPTPPGDFRTRAYIRLGETMLPKAEAYGAGLLQLFHDIVNAPAFVEEVEIYQDGQRKYRKTWMDEETPGQPPRLTRRRADSDGGELRPGTEAKIYIRIGPKQPDRQVTGFFIRKPLRTVRVTVVPDGGAAAETTTIAVTEQGEPTSPRGGTWVGTFTPTRSGILRIEATGAAEHYEDRLRQRPQSLTAVGGMRGRQGDPDADPSTPARATWRAARAGNATHPGPPYPWQGYDAGADTNHRFTVGPASGECLVAEFTPKMVESIGWGTWTGTVESEAFSKDFDRRIAGHREPHGRVFTTARTQITTNVTFHSGLLYDGDWVPSKYETPAQMNLTLKFGAGKGRFVRKHAEERRYGDHTKPVAIQQDTKDDSGLVESVTGDSRLDRPTSTLSYRIDVRSRGPGTPGATVIQLTHGKMCSDRSLTGELVRELGDPNGWSYSRMVTRWRFTFSPGPPEHIVRFPADLRQVLMGGQLNVRHYEHEVERLIGGLLESRAAVLSAQVTEAHQRSMDQIEAARRFYEDEAADTLNTRQGDLTQTYSRLSELWLGSEPDPDQAYRKELPELQAAIAGWRSAKASIEERYASATEQAADQAGTVRPDVADRLRESARRLRKDGMPWE